MDISKGMQELSALCKGKDWFYDIGTDQYGRLVVYVKQSSEDILRFVPDTAGGVQVLVHFAANKTATKDSFADDKIPPQQHSLLTKDVAKTTEFDQLVDLPFELEEQSLRHLQDELDRLEKICGTNTLSDIFFEIKDGKNAITNMSARFPDVCKSLNKLYETYGFDVLYEELEL